VCRLLGREEIRPSETTRVVFVDHGGAPAPCAARAMQRAQSESVAAGRRWEGRASCPGKTRPDLIMTS
jgi:hypothetical protein